MQMTKILFIVTGLEVGGIETYLLRFLKFSQGKIKATVLCKNGKGGTLEEEYLEVGAKIIKQKLGYVSVGSFLNLYQMLKKEKYDAVCDFTGDFAGVPLTLAKLANIETRLSFYRGSQHRFKQDYFRLFYNKIVNNLVSKNATKILSNSQAALNFFHPTWKENKENFSVIRNGVPLALFKQKFNKVELREELNIPQDAFVIGHVGRFDSAKNHKTIIKVANSLCGKYDNVYFLLCGLGVESGIKGIVQEGTINEKVIMPGLRKDIPKLLRIMDAFYFPSVTEGQPNALIESMVVGLPFVASNIEPIKECVPKDFQDCLVLPEDAIGAINKLSLYIEEKNNMRFNTVQQYARKEFQAESKFQEFLNELEKRAK